MDPNEAFSDIDKAMSTLLVAWSILKKNPRHTRYRELLEDLSEKSDEIRASAAALMDWDGRGGFRPSLTEV